MESNLSVLLLSGVNTYVIKQKSGDRMFIATPDSIVIPKPIFIQLIRVMIDGKLLEHEVLEGILEDFHSS